MYENSLLFCEYYLSLVWFVFLLDRCSFNWDHIIMYIYSYTLNHTHIIQCDTQLQSLYSTCV